MSRLFLDGLIVTLRDMRDGDHWATDLPSGPIRIRRWDRSNGRPCFSLYRPGSPRPIFVRRFQSARGAATYIAARLARPPDRLTP